MEQASSLQSSLWGTTLGWKADSEPGGHYNPAALHAKAAEIHAQIHTGISLMLNTLSINPHQFSFQSQLSQQNYHKSLPATSSHFGTYAHIWPSSSFATKACFPFILLCWTCHQPHFILLQRLKAQFSTAQDVKAIIHHNAISLMFSFLIFGPSCTAKIDYKFVCPTVHHDSESELEYDDASELDVPSSYVVGTASATTQSSASLQGGDMELEQHLQGGCSGEIGTICLMAGCIFGLDSSYFDLIFMKRDTIPEIQRMLGPGTAGGCSSPKFPPVLFTNQDMDPTMSTVFGHWEPLMKLIFILSSDTSFTKAGVGAKSQLPYAAMFMAYKQLWQSSLTSNIAMSDTEGEDFTSDMMCLAIANAGHKESNDFPGPMTTDNNPVNDIPGPIMPTTPMITPSALAVVPSAPVVVPSAPVVVPSALAITVLVPANATTAPNPATLLPAIPAPGPPVASESAGAAAATAASEDSGPSAMVVNSEVPGVPDDVPMVVTAPSSGCRGQGRKAGMLASVSSGPASEQAAGWPKQTQKK
ncbi:hypothetical protein BDR07DRAFT_1481108 [Suillus spraguei]|nr:hypothetical protein BDR07DRAFT_1481108 [Suillus spraguei]